MTARILALAAAALVPFALGAQSDLWERVMQEAADLEHEGNFPSALASYREAIRLAEASDSGRVRLPPALNALGQLQESMGLYLDAERSLGRAMTLLEESSGRQSVDYAIAQSTFASVLFKRDNPERAEKLIRESLATLAKKGTALQLALVESSLAEILVSKEAYREAEPLLMRATEVFEKAPEPREGRLGMALNNLGVIRSCQARRLEAAQILKRAVALLESEFGGSHPVLVQPLNNLAAVYVNGSDYRNAGIAFQRALSIAESRLGNTHPLYGAVLTNYAELLRRSGRKKESRTLAARSKHVLSQNARTNGIGLTVDASSLPPQH